MKRYVRPSQCEQCVPVESYADNIIEYAHEPECPNTRKRRRR